jgi:signal transduction histidine kinase
MSKNDTQPAPPSYENGTTTNILVVDDETFQRALLRNILRKAGFHAIEACNGESALVLAENHPPHLILLDVLMPGMNGFDTCKRFKNHPQLHEIPVIFMSSLADIPDKVKGFTLGAADYIAKPVDEQEVVARVKTHLNLYLLQQQLQVKNHELEQLTSLLAQRNQELKNYTYELEKRNLELDSFAHAVSHDLSNPLAGVLRVISRLTNADSAAMDEAMRQEGLRMAEQSALKMQSIIEAMLLLAGVSRKQSVPIIALDMAYLAGQAMQRLQDLQHACQATVELPAQWPLAYGHSIWIEEVWVNYLSNAYKYGGHPPRLQLGGEMQADGMARYWVRDHGPGLTPQARQVLFTPFTRLHEKRADGNGLGLSIVLQIIEKLGGEAGVESVPGQGSRFYFTLPGTPPLSANP